MIEPWATLITAGLPSIIAAYLAYRGLLTKERLAASGAEANRVDVATRMLIEAQMKDNARLREENADLTKALAHWIGIARRWCDKAHEMRHGRNNDRMVAEVLLTEAGIDTVNWKPNPSLPAFEEIA